MGVSYQYRPACGRTALLSSPNGELKGCPPPLHFELASSSLEEAAAGMIRVRITTIRGHLSPLHCNGVGPQKKITNTPRTTGA